MKRKSRISASSHEEKSRFEPDQTARQKSKRHSSPRPIPSLFNDEWIEHVKASIKGFEDNDLDKPNRTFSESARSSFAYFCLAYTALDALDPDQFADVIANTEAVCNKFGYSFLPDNFTINKCPTKSHRECTGKWVHKMLGKKIICRCACHGKNSMTENQ